MLPRFHRGSFYIPRGGRRAGGKFEIMNSEFGIVVPPAAAIGIYAELTNTILQGRPPSAARRHGTGCEGGRAVHKRPLRRKPAFPRSADHWSASDMVLRPKSAEQCSALRAFGCRNARRYGMDSFQFSDFSLQETKDAGFSQFRIPNFPCRPPDVPPSTAPGHKKTAGRPTGGFAYSMGLQVRITRCPGPSWPGPPSGSRPHWRPPSGRRACRIPRRRRSRPGRCSA